MSKNISLKKIKKILNSVKHPAINSTLYDLGILKDINLKDGKAVITLAFPHPSIPIKDLLIGLVKNPLVDLGLAVDVETIVMNEEELQKFLALEQENWRG